MIENRAKLLFLYTNIGRGHPFYLDGIAESLVRSGKTGLIRQSKDVFDLSGVVPRQFWKMARTAYRLGATDGWIGRRYNQFRKQSDYNQKSLLLRLAGRDIEREIDRSTADYILVAHPILVGILKDRPRLVYQHGELVVPAEALVRGAQMVLVPTQEAADRFIQAGYDSEQLLVTGLCIEPALVRQAKDSFELRMKRIDKSDTLTGALFSSGAEPGAHLQRLMAITRSLLENGHRAVVVTTERGRLDHAITELAERSGYVYSALSNRSEIPYDLPPLTIVRAADRRDESRLVAQLFPSFDFVVAPPHERTNWGIGLGLPFFAITPCYGSFAPLNLELLLAQGVGRAVSSSSEALHFASSLKRLSREGGLAKMALNGWERAPINGFSTIAAWLAERLTKPDHA